MAVMSSGQFPVLRRSRLAQEAGTVTPFYGELAYSNAPQTSKIDPTDDLRSRQITSAQIDPRTQQQVGSARDRLASFSGYSPYAAPQTNDQYTQQANQYLGQAYQSGNYGALPNTSTGPSQQYLNQLSGLAGQFGQFGGGGLSYGADTSALRGQLQNYLQGLQSGPDRSELARQSLKLYEEESEPAYQQRLRGVGQSAAALGRIGAGMTTSELGDVATLRERELARRRQDLALQAAGQTQADKLNIAAAMQGGLGTLAGLDQAAAQAALQGQGQRLSALGQGADVLRGLASDQLSLSRLPREEAESAARLGLEQGRFRSGLAEQAFGFGRGVRDESRTDQDAIFGREQADLAARRGIFGDLAGYEGQQFGQNQARADELRGERGYQTEASQRGIDNAVRQRLLEDQLQGSSLGRNTNVLRNLYDLGYGYDPSGAYQDQARFEQGVVGDTLGGVGDLLGTVFQDRAQRGNRQSVIPSFHSPELPDFGTFGQGPIDWRSAPQGEVATNLPYGGFRPPSRLARSYGSFQR